MLLLIGSLRNAPGMSASVMLIVCTSFSILEHIYRLYNIKHYDAGKQSAKVSHFLLFQYILPQNGGQIVRHS